MSYSSRRHINLYRMVFPDFSVNSQLIFMKFCRDYFRIMQVRPNVTASRPIALSASFEYLCYGYKTIRKYFILSVRGPSLYVSEFDVYNSDV